MILSQAVCVLVQSISFRDAFYVPIMADRPGFRLEDIFCDIVHPNAVGHRYQKPNLSRVAAKEKARTIP